MRVKVCCQVLWHSRLNFCPCDILAYVLLVRTIMQSVFRCICWLDLVKYLALMVMIQLSCFIDVSVAVQFVFWLWIITAAFQEQLGLLLISVLGCFAILHFFQFSFSGFSGCFLFVNLCLLYQYTVDGWLKRLKKVTSGKSRRLYTLSQKNPKHIRR